MVKKIEVQDAPGSIDGFVWFSHIRALADSLTNDEASSDEELQAYFRKEFLLSPEQAEKCVDLRDHFQMALPTPECRQEWRLWEIAMDNAMRFPMVREMTGGGCVAWTSPVKWPEGFFWVTDESGGNLPTDIMNETMLIGIYDNEGDELELFTVKGMAELLQWCTENLFYLPVQSLAVVNLEALLHGIATMMFLHEMEKHGISVSLMPPDYKGGERVTTNIAITIAGMSQHDIDSMLDEAVEAALNAGCLYIQERIGQNDGGTAGVFFSGDATRQPIREQFAEYFDLERRTYHIDEDMDWDDPVARYKLIETIGPEKYNELMDEHFQNSIIETVNGYGIRPVKTQFGKLYQVVGTAMAFKHITEAKTHAFALTPAGKFLATGAEYQEYMDRVKAFLQLQPSHTVAIMGGNFMLIDRGSLCCGAMNRDGSVDSSLGEPDVSAWEESWKDQLENWLSAPVIRHLTEQEIAKLETESGYGKSAII